MTKLLWVSPLARSCGQSNLLPFSSHVTLLARENSLRYCFEKWRSVLAAHAFREDTFPLQAFLPSSLVEAWRGFSSCAIPLHLTISLCRGTVLCLGDPLQLCLREKGPFDPVGQRQICRSRSSGALNPSPHLVYCRTSFIGKKKKSSLKCRVWLMALSFSFLPHASLPPLTPQHSL